MLSLSGFVVSSLLISQCKSRQICLKVGLTLFNSGKIFFDGLLPEPKQAERWQRLQNATNDVCRCRNGYPHGPWFISGYRFSDGTDTGKLGQVRGRLQILPPPAFLVSSVLEILQSSEFGFCTSTVPGEADAYCADHVRENGGIILTNDSDLLVHDLGSDGSVIFLSDITFPNSGKNTSLNVLQFRPKEIEKRLGLKSMIQLALAMKEKRWFQESVQLGKSFSTESLEYVNFSSQFSTLPCHSKLLEAVRFQDCDNLLDMLRWLDARTSEFVHESVKVLSPFGQTECAKSENLGPIPMYLPILLEDPTKATAWTCGAEIRSIGYSFLNINARNGSVDEVGRRGTEIVKRVVPLQSLQDVSQSCNDLLESIEKHFQRHSASGVVDIPIIWQTYGAKIVCETLLKSGKPVPPKAEMLQLVKFEHSMMDSWAHVHLDAQLQGALYSLRMLKQFLDVFLAATLEVTSNNNLGRLAAEVHKRLATLPPLNHLMESPVNKVETRSEDLERAIEILYKSSGIKEVAETTALSRQEKKKMKKKAKRAGALSKGPPTVNKGTAPKNMFSVLAGNDTVE